MPESRRNDATCCPLPRQSRLLCSETSCSERAGRSGHANADESQHLRGAVRLISPSQNRPSTSPSALGLRKQGRRAIGWALFCGVFASELETGFRNERAGTNQPGRGCDEETREVQCRLPTVQADAKSHGPSTPREGAGETRRRPDNRRNFPRRSSEIASQAYFCKDESVGFARTVRLAAYLNVTSPSDSWTLVTRASGSPPRGGPTTKQPRSWEVC